MNYLQKVEYAKRLIEKEVEEYPNITLGCSFGKDSMVTLDLVRRVEPDIPVFALLANTEFEETYEFVKHVVALYGLNYTEHLFQQEEGEQCCGEPKVKKATEALRGYDAWISGVRTTEGITRSDFKAVENKGGLIKVNPILDFTELDIWRYTALNRLPVNPMYLKGYRSLGCKFCSAPEKDESETEREGRWEGTPFARGECGIHTKRLR